MTLGQIAAKTEGELLRIRNFGRKNVIEVQQVLSLNGLALRDAAGPPEPDGPDTAGNRERVQWMPPSWTAGSQIQLR